MSLSLQVIQQAKVYLFRSRSLSVNGILSRRRLPSTTLPILISLFSKRLATNGNLFSRRSSKSGTLSVGTVQSNPNCAEFIYAHSGQLLDGSIRFADFVGKWLEDYAAVPLRPVTIEGYRQLLKRIIPAIGHIRLSKLQPHHLQELYRNLSESGIRADGKQRFCKDFDVWIKERRLTRRQAAELVGVSDTTVRQMACGRNVSYETAQKVAKAFHVPMKSLFEPASAPDAVLSANSIQHYHKLISSILSTAVEWQVIFANPCDRVKPPKVPHREAQYLDDKQAAHLLELLEQLPDEQLDFRTAVTVLLFTGMRRSELLGLCWKDIDMETGVVSINHTSKYLPGKGIIEDETKNTSSRRSFKVPKELLPLLKRYNVWQMQHRLMVGDQWQDTERLFTSWNGSPMRPNTFTRRFRKWIAETDLPNIHPHSLRHTNATLLIANGTNIQTVSKRLGHSTSSTTANIYAHAIQSADAAAAEAVPVFKLNQKKNG